MGQRIDRSNVSAQFWKEKSLSEMTSHEWESLCDGCGKCCLNKLEDEEGTVELTCVSCILLDPETGRCKSYNTRRDTVPECIQLTEKTIAQHLYWLPQTCAYRLVFEGHDLPSWHPLNSGREESVLEAGVSVAGLAVPENTVHENEWDDYIIKEPGV